MGQLQRITGANDNSPTWVMDRPTSKKAENSSPQSTVRPQPTQHRNVSTITWCFLLAALVAGAWAWGTQVPMSHLIWPASAIGIMLLLTAAAAKTAFRLRNLCVLGAITAFSTSLIATSANAGITLYTTDIAVLIAVLAGLVAWVFKSRPALMLSSFAALFWLLSLSPNLSASFGLSTPSPQGWIPLLCVLVIAQMALAHHLRAYLPICTSILTVAGLAVLLGSSLPSLPLAGVLFAGSAAHHRLGKAWADQNIFGARLHLTMGWMAAIGTAFYIQAHWLSFSPMTTQRFWSPTSIWWSALFLSGLLILVSSIIRYKHAQITLSGIFLVSMGALVLPLSSVRPDLVIYAFKFLPGLPAQLGFGIAIGAIVMASGVAWIVNGLRRGQILNITLGALVVAFQAIFLLGRGGMTPDLLITFALSLILALCISGLIAGSALNHSPPARRYA